MANMLGKRAQQRYGYAGRHCPCCSIDKVVREQKHSTRQVEDRQWRKDADELSPAQEQYELDAWYERIGYESDPWYELPPGFDGVWSTESGNVSYR